MIVIRWSHKIPKRNATFSEREESLGEGTSYQTTYRDLIATRPMSFNLPNLRCSWMFFEWSNFDMAAFNYMLSLRSSYLTLSRPTSRDCGYIWNEHTCSIMTQQPVLVWIFIQYSDRPVRTLPRRWPWSVIFVHRQLWYDKRKSISSISEMFNVIQRSLILIRWQRQGGSVNDRTEFLLSDSRGFIAAGSKPVSNCSSIQPSSQIRNF